MIRLLRKNEPVPYNLLLLADEVMEVIETYIGACEIYIEEYNEEAIGVYTLQVIDPTTIEIKDLAVREDYQRRGIGTALLTDAFRVASQKGFKNIVIGTGDALIFQLYLYQKVGFEMYEIRHNFFIDNYPYPMFENGLQLKHMVRLRKQLSD